MTVLTGNKVFVFRYGFVGSIVADSALAFLSLILWGTATARTGIQISIGGGRSQIQITSYLHMEPIQRFLSERVISQSDVVAGQDEARIVILGCQCRLLLLKDKVLEGVHSMTDCVESTRAALLSVVVD